MSEAPLAKTEEQLFSRVANILEEARGNVVRAVNTNMVLGYWLIGREIVETLQEGEKRAAYGKGVLGRLSARLTERFGAGYSERNLRHFRQFFSVFADRLVIRNPAGTELPSPLMIGNPLGAESNSPGSEILPAGRISCSEQITNPAGSKSRPGDRAGFSALLTWSHYRALMRVEDEKARAFYEAEAIECAWSKAQLERQIHSALYQRIIANQGPAGLVKADRERLAGEPVAVTEVLRSPLVLEFLNLPDSPLLHESQLEQAIIQNLQSFMLELGKGFAFVARQKHIRFDDEDFYIDLVFYNYLLKCFLLVDLKIGKLSHRDVGQMDGYVRLYEERFKVEGDNPTIGLILCSDKSEAVAKYSVLAEGQQIFAAKYLQFLPTEQELKTELERERRLLDAREGDSDEL